MEPPLLGPQTPVHPGRQSTHARSIHCGVVYEKGWDQNGCHQNKKITNAGKNVQQGDPHALLVRMPIRTAALETSVEVPQKPKLEPHLIQRSHYWVNRQRKGNQQTKRLLHHVLLPELFTMAKVWNQLGCPRIDPWIKRARPIHSGILPSHKKE